MSELTSLHADIRKLDREVRRLRTSQQQFAAGDQIRADAIVGVIPSANVPAHGSIGLWTNQSGGALGIGAVVIQNGDRQFNTTVTVDDLDVVGVLTEAIANTAEGRLRHQGYHPSVIVEGAVVAGQFLRTSTTAGAAEDAGTTPTSGTFGMALTAAAGPGAGTVAAYLFGTIGGVSDHIVDADGDTGIQVEEAADEDIIRFDVAGTETLLMGDTGGAGDFGGAAHQMHFPMVADQDILIDGATNPRMIDTGVLRFEHIPGIPDTRCLTFNVDANSEPGTHAVVVNMIATQIAAGEVVSAYDVNLIGGNSTGGIMRAFEVSVAGNGIVAHALHVDPNVVPLTQHSGSFINVESAWENALDVTAAFNAAGVDVELFSVNGDVVTIGMAAKFDNIEVVLDTAASGAGIKPTFEYSTGGPGWTAFPASDETLGFRQDGLISWDSSDLAGWATQVDNGVNKYWIRITRTQVGLTTPPIEDTIQVQAITEYGWNAVADVTIKDLSAVDAALSGTLTVDIIDEITPGAGTTIEGVQLLDSDVLISSTNFLQFRDSALQIWSSADGQLDLKADVEIELTAATVDIPSGRLDIGADDATRGSITLYGANLNTGGQIVLFTAANQDTTIEGWLFEIKSGTDDLVWTAGADERMLLTQPGQLQLPTGGGAAGILIRDSDLQIWSSADGQLDLKADVTVEIDAGTLVSLPGGNLGVGVNDTTSGLVVLYGDNANAGGSLLMGMGANQDTTHESWTFGVKASSDDLEWKTNVGDKMLLTAEGQLQLPTDGSGGGLRIGGDWDLYTTAANVAYSPDILNHDAPAARAYNNANISVNNATWTALSLNFELFDNDTMHDTITNNSRMTATTDGVYQITGHIDYASDGTGFRAAAIRLGGSIYIAVVRVDANSSDVTDLVVTTLYHMTAGQYVELMAHQTSGGALNVLTQSRFSPDLMMVRVAD